MDARDSGSTRTAGHTNALELHGVTKSFAGVTVLRDVDFVVRPSSVHAVVGHNGSGKSTLIKTMAGFHRPDHGVEGRVFGRPFVLGDYEAAAKVGLRFVHQDLGLVDRLSAVDNLALGPGFPTRAGVTIRWREASRRTSAALGALGYHIDVGRPVGSLSPSERTGVAIARALEGWSGEPAVVVLDEPTASMPAPEVDRLFTAIGRLRDQGIGIVYVSHHLNEILDFADDVTVLRDGQVVKARQVAGLSHDELVTSIVGRELAAIMRTSGETAVAASRPPVLEVKELGTRHVHGLSFGVAAGEIVGLAGIGGSGRDEVLPALAGDIGRLGTVQIGGTTVRPGHPRSAIRAGLGYVPANRRESAVLPTMDAARNLTVSTVRPYARLGLLLSRHKETTDAAAWLDKLGVTPATPHAPILTLSGGNQQKVMVGRWLRCKPSLLALDEPTQGVDVGAKQTIYHSLQQAAKAGNGVLISSADGDELAAVCHRVLVVVRGQVVAELVGSDLEGGRIDGLCLDNRGAATA